MRNAVITAAIAFGLGCAGATCLEDDIRCQRDQLEQALEIADQLIDVAEAVVPEDSDASKVIKVVDEVLDVVEAIVPTGDDEEEPEE